MVIVVVVLYFWPRGPHTDPLIYSLCTQHGQDGQSYRHPSRQWWPSDSSNHPFQSSTTHSIPLLCHYNQQQQLLPLCSFFIWQVNGDAWLSAVMKYKAWHIGPADQAAMLHIKAVVTPSEGPRSVISHLISPSLEPSLDIDQIDQKVQWNTHPWWFNPLP